MSGVKKYFGLYPTDSDSDNVFIAIIHGEQGYHTTTVYSQTHADVLNARQGITIDDFETAVICSMFDCWDNFETIKAAYLR